MTKEEDISKVIFNKLDEELLKKVVVDGNEVEYEHYLPIIPMILVNGGEGIACGFSTKIPSYNPEDIVRWIRAWLNN